jgi:NAD(P)-dependent dehydrogenase (short-subunit alcohol dehydrogenase family)
MFYSISLFNFCRHHYYAAEAYNQSKLAQVLTSKHMNKFLQNEGAKVQTHSLHPGVVDTDLFENTSTTYIPWFRKIFFKVRSHLQKNK